MEQGRGQGGGDDWKSPKQPPLTRVWSEGGGKVVVGVGKARNGPPPTRVWSEGGARWW
jgi:hypothetical protein